MEFKPFGKIARLSRECVVTEKLDGTNACVYIGEDGSFLTASRTRWITPEDDNYGFARWAQEHKAELMELGHGHHFGEWWGAGIQRKYNIPEKRFSLFNVAKWGKVRPACCHVVPVLYRGRFDTHEIDCAITALRIAGSAAAPGFMQPEGVVVFHEAAGQLFKKTCAHDEEPKGAHPKKDRVPHERKPKNPAIGGRRKEQLPFSGADRRAA